MLRYGKRLAENSFLRRILIITFVLVFGAAVPGLMGADHRSLVDFALAMPSLPPHIDKGQWAGALLTGLGVSVVPAVLGVADLRGEFAAGRNQAELLPQAQPVTQIDLFGDLAALYAIDADARI